MNDELEQIFDKAGINQGERHPDTAEEMKARLREPIQALITREIGKEMANALAAIETGDKYALSVMGQELVWKVRKLLKDNYELPK